METSTTQLLQHLAEKLNTTASNIWEVLIRQATVSAINDIIVYIILISLSVIWFKAHKRLSKVKDYGDYSPESGYSHYEESGAGIIMGVIGGILGIILLIMIFCIGDTITAFVNPEYWALHKILEAIK